METPKTKGHREVVPTPDISQAPSEEPDRRALGEGRRPSAQEARMDHRDRCFPELVTHWSTPAIAAGLVPDQHLTPRSVAISLAAGEIGAAATIHWWRCPDAGL